MNSIAKNPAGLRIVIVITTALVFFTGCGEDERLRQAEKERRLWQILAGLAGIVALVAFATRPSNSSGPSSFGAGGNSGGGPGMDNRPKPPMATQSSAQDEVSGTHAPHKVLSGSSSIPTNGSNGVSGKHVRTNGIKTAAIPIVSGMPTTPARPAWRSDYFVLDGLNICLSYHPTQQFRLETLLCLSTQILKHGAGLECHFDASAKHRALEMGSSAQREAYEALLLRHPEVFSEVSAGDPADDTLLFRADSKSCPVISNDRFTKPEEGYVGTYPWVKVKGRVVRGQVYDGRLLVTALGIDVPIEPDLDQAVRSFEIALRDFRSAAPKDLPLAA